MTRLQRIVLYELHRLERERPGRSIPVVQLYGRVVERINCSEEELRGALQQLGAAHKAQS